MNDIQEELQFDIQNTQTTQAADPQHKLLYKVFKPHHHRSNKSLPLIKIKIGLINKINGEVELSEDENDYRYIISAIEVTTQILK